MQTLITFDFEPEWCVVGRKYKYCLWERYDKKVHENLDKFLAVCEKHGVRSTIFIVSKIAKDYSDILNEAIKAGHEIGSHSFSHPDLTTLTDAELQKEVTYSRSQLQDLFGLPINGFRAPRFKIDKRGLIQVAHSGYVYDSSLVQPNFIANESTLELGAHTNLRELPFVKHRFMRHDRHILGGGFMRIYPRRILENLNFKNYNMLYIHSHDFNFFTPKYAHMSYKDFALRNIKCGSTMVKLEKILAREDMSFHTCSEFMAEIKHVEL